MPSTCFRGSSRAAGPCSPCSPSSRLGHVRNSIAFRPSPLPTLTVPAWPVFPRPDSWRATPPPWQPSADACTNGRANIFLRLGDRSHPKSLLAISGGGDNGAFGAGVLVGWSESRTRPSFKIVTGISTGALIAPLAFVGPEYDPLLAEMYTTIGQSDIFEKRPVLAGLVSDALADSMPLRNLIAKYVDAKLVARIAEESRRGRALVIITTNLDAGVPVIWNIGAIAESGRPEAIGLIRKILLASASIPGFFPPVMFDVTVDGVAHQEMHVDGGASMQTFLYPAALQVRQIPNGGGSRPAPHTLSVTGV